MSSIVLKNVDFHYESPLNEVFQDLSLLIDTGWRTALVGRNGQGKTTLLNLLTGALSPQSGSVAVPVATRLFPFPVSLIN